MNVVVKQISELHPAEKNVRLHPQKQIDEMKRSVEMFGQYRPLIVTADGEILVGNGLYETYLQMGKETIECIVLPDDTTDKQKKKLMLADNKIFSLGKDFLSNIDELLGEFEDFDIPGFDEEILNNLYNEINDSIPKDENVPAAFGVIPKERVEEIKKTEQTRQENPQEDDEKKYDLQPAVLENHENGSEEENRNYITCPHCGVKIYGYN